MSELFDGENDALLDEERDLDSILEELVEAGPDTKTLLDVAKAGPFISFHVKRQQEDHRTISQDAIETVLARMYMFTLARILVAWQKDDHAPTDLVIRMGVSAWSDDKYAMQELLKALTDDPPTPRKDRLN